MRALAMAPPGHGTPHLIRSGPGARTAGRLPQRRAGREHPAGTGIALLPQALSLQALLHAPAHRHAGHAATPPVPYSWCPLLLPR